MILTQITSDQTLTVALWVIGGFLAVLFTLLIHIGNAGAAIKKTLGLHGERLSHVETGLNDAKNTAHRMEDKLDRLIERK